MKYAMLILKNLARSKRRTLLTVFSIAVSLFIFSALISLPTAAHRVPCRIGDDEAVPSPRWAADSASRQRLSVQRHAEHRRRNEGQGAAEFFALPPRLSRGGSRPPGFRQYVLGARGSSRECSA